MAASLGDLRRWMSGRSDDELVAIDPRTLLLTLVEDKRFCFAVGPVPDKPPMCPECNLKMVTAQGPSAKFFACPNDPVCPMRCWRSDEGEPHGKCFNNRFYFMTRNTKSVLREMCVSGIRGSMLDLVELQRRLTEVVGRQVDQYTQDLTEEECATINTFHRDLFPTAFIRKSQLSTGTVPDAQAPTAQFFAERKPRKPKAGKKASLIQSAPLTLGADTVAAIQ